ncbi:MAG: hypothetical protein N3A64_02620 [Desulfobacterota bacterium]|nr:hypothetical protein [Thermodesulfobacteriota bacterium]
MKCPKCGYFSPDYLDSCKKCGKDLLPEKVKLGLSYFRISSLTLNPNLNKRLTTAIHPFLEEKTAQSGNRTNHLSSIAKVEPPAFSQTLENKHLEELQDDWEEPSLRLSNSASKTEDFEFPEELTKSSPPHLIPLSGEEEESHDR